MGRLVMAPATGFAPDRPLSGEHDRLRMFLDAARPAEVPPPRDDLLPLLDLGDDAHAPGPDFLLVEETCSSMSGIARSCSLII